MRPCDTLTGRAALAIRALYAEHPVGGALHIVTDDLNVEESSLRWCRARMEERGASKVEWAALHALERLSKTARKKAAMTFRDAKWDTP